MTTIKNAITPHYNGNKMSPNVYKVSRRQKRNGNRLDKHYTLTDELQNNEQALYTKTIYNLFKKAVKIK